MSFYSFLDRFAGKSAFPASLESLKREALKNLLKHTGKLAGDGLLPCLRTEKSLRFAPFSMT